MEEYRKPGKAQDDPYSVFVVRVMNSVRLALREQGAMSEDEVEIVKGVYEALVSRDPAANRVRMANIVVR